MFATCSRNDRADNFGAHAIVHRHVVGAFRISFCHRLSLGVAATATRGAGPGYEWIGRAAVERKLLRHYANVAYSRAVVHRGRGIVGHRIADVVARRATY